MEATWLWAKSASDGRWHSLPCHLLDVAACAEQLWNRLPIGSRSVYSEPSLPVFLAATHDIGKANRFFQAKALHQAGRLRTAGVELCETGEEPRRHGQATGAYLKQWMTNRWGWSSFDASCVARAVGGHHGLFFEDCDPRPLQVDRQPWSSVAVDLLDNLATMLCSDIPTCPQPLNPFLGWLAGFISVADWLGSHEEMTIWEDSPKSLGDYLIDARRRAAILMDFLGWVTPNSAVLASLEDLLPKFAEPNDLQLTAWQISRDFSLAIVEAPTGEGKTEAAYALCEPSRADGQGIYFALPTMATANGLYERVRRYLHDASDNEVIATKLLHSQAWLYRERVAMAHSPGEEGEMQEASATDWFDGPKRGLLAPYAVGTIDQALIAALKARHGFIRLFALAGKVIVIDEVHAYDVYMGDLLDVLLGWLRSLGCKVILLSATLPQARREALVRAWAHVDASKVDKWIVCGEGGERQLCEYPCITWVESAGFTKCKQVSVTPRKPLTIKLVPFNGEPMWLAAAKLAQRILHQRGGLSVLVLNTVRDAQLAFAWLRENATPQDGLDLFHARFTAYDRERLEKHVLETYGKQAGLNGDRILVATQVVEQSLDLDFDNMVTALAPIDLLIQRAGRLHRHARGADRSLLGPGQTDERLDASLHVLGPLSELGESPEFSDPVYSHAILLRTYAMLKRGLVIEKPKDVSRAIEMVYSEADREEVVKEWDDGFAERLAELEGKTRGEVDRQRREARRVTIPNVWDTDRLIVEAQLDLDENDERSASRLAARTRLEDRPSVKLALLQSIETTIHGQSTTDLRAVSLATVSCSPPFPLWESLIALEPLAAWLRKGPVAYTRPVVLNDGRAHFGDFELTYDSVMGLQWRKMNAEL